MKNEIKAKINSTKKFVHNNKTAIACTASAVVAATASVAVYIKIQDRRTLLEVTNDSGAYMQTGGGVAYDTKYGLVMTKIISPEDLPIPA